MIVTQNLFMVSKVNYYLHFWSLTLSYVVCKRTLCIHDNNIVHMSSKLVHTTYVCTLLPSCILIIQYIMHLTKSIVTLPDSLIAIYERSKQSVEFLNLLWCFSQETVCIFSNQSFAFKVVQLHFRELNISLQPWMLSINSILWLRKSSRFPKCNLVYFKRMYSGIRLINYKA